MDNNLLRFKEAQKESYASAYKELQAGKKKTHWMWYIFPQIKGLGRSSMATYYAIHDMKEAVAYLQDEELHTHLVNLCEVLLLQEKTNSIEIFGSIDSQKLQSSMTLFSYAAELLREKDAAKSGKMPTLFINTNEEDTENQIFNQVLEKFFNGKKDKATESLIFFGELPKEMPKFTKNEQKLR